MFWGFLICWIFSTVICWIIFAICNEFDADWCYILEDYKPYHVAILTLPVVNVLFILFVFVSSIWKLIKNSFFNKNFYISVKELLEEIWKS